MIIFFFFTFIKGFPKSCVLIIIFTDTENMKFVFEAVRDTILQINLKHFNLV